MNAEMKQVARFSPNRYGLFFSLLLASVSLLAGMFGGLVRVGSVNMAAEFTIGDQSVANHGAFMMAGFFGTLISLERAVALHRGFWVPLSSGVAGVLALLGQWPWASGLWLLSALGLCELYVWAARHRAISLPLLVEASAAVALVWAALSLIQGDPLQARWAWSLFLVLTILGERRELMRLRPLPAWASQAFLWVWGCFALAAALMSAYPLQSAWLMWSLLGIVSIWLLCFDLARLQWRKAGWAGHTAICLLVGYVWLLLAGLAGLFGHGQAGGVAWHLLWLGFVLAMVFGHAPLMLPALLGVRPRHSWAALVPLGVLAASLVLRTFGSLLGDARYLAWAGAGHLLALLTFALTMAWLVRGNSDSRP